MGRRYLNIKAIQKPNLRWEASHYGFDRVRNTVTFVESVEGIVKDMWVFDIRDLSFTGNRDQMIFRRSLMKLIQQEVLP